LTTNPLNKEEVEKNLSAKNPYTTVRIKNLPESSRLPANNSILYHNDIKKAYQSCCSNLTIHYDLRNAFLEFKSSFSEYNHISKIAPAVYFAICMRQLRIQIELVPLKENDENKYILREIERKKAIETNKYTNNCTNRMTIDSEQDSMSDPSLLIKNLNEFKLVVCHVNAFGHFYGQINTEDAQHRINEIQKRLNSTSYQLKRLPKDQLYLGKFVAAPFVEGLGEVSIYRARITQINQDYLKVMLSFIINL